MNFSGTVVNHIIYDSFGRIVSETNPVAFTYAYTGRELDRETGLQFNRARYYDSHSERFISLDPLGLTTDESNPYRYSHNNPLLRIDPTGLTDFVYNQTTGEFTGGGIDVAGYSG